MKTVAIIIARMGSTRLPGKVLMELNGDPVLTWVLKAACAATEVNEVWVATSTDPRDDAIVEWAKSLNRDDFGKFDGETNVFRGSETDVLERVHGCAAAANADLVVRITGDCPFVDPAIISGVVRMMKQRSHLDYVSNVNPPTWPDGLDVEVFTRRALSITHASARLSSDRDTVTQFMVRNRHEFTADNFDCPLPDLHQERWVLDTEEDLLFCRAVAEGLNVLDPPGYLDILQFLEENPQLRLLNAMWERNERFFDSLITEPPHPKGFGGQATFNREMRRLSPLGGAGTYSKSYVAWGTGNGPLYVTHGQGSHVFDIDGYRYIDWTAGLLAVTCGYSHPTINEAIRGQLRRGISFPLGSLGEIDLAEALSELFPWATTWTFAKNGSDVTTAAIRLARVATNRQHVIALWGSYHGWHDWTLGGTGRGAGITKDLDVYLVSRTFDWEPPGNKVAAIVLEGTEPVEWWCQAAAYREKYGCLLIADEMVSGMRYPGLAAHMMHGIQPDLVCFGKGIANGMAVSALGGTRDLMRWMTPQEGGQPNAFFSGTFFGEQLSIEAAICTLRLLQDKDAQAWLAYCTQNITSALEKATQGRRIAVTHDLDPLARFQFPADPRHAIAFRHHMARMGCLVYSGFFPTLMTTEADLTRTRLAIEYAFDKMAAGDIDYRVEPTGIMRR